MSPRLPLSFASRSARSALFAAVPATVLAMSASAYAASEIEGGGATVSGPTHTLEFSLFNQSTTSATFGTYWESGSAAGQNGLLTDDLSCDINAVTGSNNKQCNGGSSQGAAGNIAHYGASDAVFTTSQTAFWSNFSLGQAAAGNLIQLPVLGNGIAFPVVSPVYTTSSGATTSAQFSDNDLCGIFSGKITDWSQITDQPNKTTGPLTVVYRSDGAGTTFLLTSHLSRVCKTGTKGNSNITFGPTQTLAALFPNGTPPSNFVGASKNSGVAAQLIAYENTSTQAVGYVTPNYTSLTPNSPNVNNLVVAQVAPVLGGTVYLPTTTNIATGLANPGVILPGSPLKPPKTAAAGANPINWVPVIQTVKKGYPIVGYTTLDFAQCYQDMSVAVSIIQFLNLNYTNASYISIENNNGFVALPSSGAKAFLPAIQQHILLNAGTKKSPAWNDNIQNSVKCAGLPGR